MLGLQWLRVRMSRACRLTNVSRPAAAGSLGIDWRQSRRAKRVGCITGAPIQDGGCSTGCTGLEPLRRGKRYLDPRRVGCITGASDRAGGPAGCPGLEVVEEYGAAGVKTQAGACWAAGGMDGGARRRRRDSMDSKGSAPVSTAIAGTAFARLGILTLDGNHLTPPPIPECWPGSV